MDEPTITPIPGSASSLPPRNQPPQQPTLQLDTTQQPQSATASAVINNNTPSADHSQQQPPPSQWQPPQSQPMQHSNSNPAQSPANPPQQSGTPQPQHQPSPSQYHPPHPSHPAGAGRPPSDPSTPLPPELQAQFYSRFKVPPPQTQGQLQEFLAKHAAMMGQARARAAAQGNVGMPGGPQQHHPGANGQQGSSAQGQSHNQAMPPPSGNAAQINRPASQNSNASTAPHGGEAAPNGNGAGAGVDGVNVANTPGSDGGVAGYGGIPGMPANGINMNQLAAMDKEGFMRQMRALQESRRQASSTPNPAPSPSADGLANGLGPQSSIPSSHSNILPHNPPTDISNLPPNPSAQTFALQLPPRKTSQPQAQVPPGGQNVQETVENGVTQDYRPGSSGTGSVAQSESATPAPPSVNGIGNNNTAQQKSSASGPTLPNGQHQHPNAPPGATTIAPGRPPQPQASHTQAAIAAHAATSFYATLHKHLTAQGQYFPPGLFQVQPAAPGVPGATPTAVGQLDVAGRKLDLMKLWYTTMQQGGHAKIMASNSWPKLAHFLGLPLVLSAPQSLPRLPQDAPDAPPRTTTSAGEYVSVVYQVYLASFEESWKEQQEKRQQAAGVAKAQGNGTGLAAGSPVSANGSASQMTGQNGATTSAGVQEEKKAVGSDAMTPQNGMSAPSEATSSTSHAMDVTLSTQQTAMNAIGHAASSTAPIALSGLAQMNASAGGAPSPRNPTFQSTFQAVPSQNPGGPAMGPQVSQQSTSVGSPMAVDEDAKSKKRKKSSKKDKQEGNGVDDRSTSSTPAPSTAPLPSVQPPSEPIHVAKRARYRVEYKPMERELGSHGGWDLNAINHDFSQRKRHRRVAMVDDLGTVDIEGLGMSLRSGIGSEVTYALTALGMLSMPGLGDDKGGLGLVHCGELLSDLVDVIEEATFGEGGWQVWHDSICGEEAEISAEPSHTGPIHRPWPRSHEEMVQTAKEVDGDLNDLLHVDKDLAESEKFTAFQANPRLLFSGRNVDIALVGTNLLRNFAMMNDNYTFMSECLPFLNLMSRICDVRLAKSTRSHPRMRKYATFSMSELLRIRKDVLQVISSLSHDIRLHNLPLETTAAYFKLVSAFVLDAPGSSASAKLSEAGRPPQQMAVAPHLDYVMDVLCRLAVYDYNRVVIRLLPEDDLLAIFMAVVRLLPITAQDSARVGTYPIWQEFGSRSAMALYNIAFLAQPSLRSRIRETPGVLGLLSQILCNFVSSKPTPPNIQIMCRRIAATLGALTGTQDVSTEPNLMTFGPEAGVNGWTRNTGRVVEPGILAGQEDMMFKLLGTSRMKDDPIDLQIYSDLDKAVWT